MASALLPLGVGDTTTSTVFAADIGREYENKGRLYKLVKASVLIAAGSQGLILSAVVTSAKPTGAVILNVTSGNYYACGAIPSTLTGAIAASAYFLALIQGHDLLSVTASGVGSVTSGTALIPGTASDLKSMTTGATAVEIALAMVANCGIATYTTTGTVILATDVDFRAPYRFSVP